MEGAGEQCCRVHYHLDRQGEVVGGGAECYGRGRSKILGAAAITFGAYKGCMTKTVGEVATIFCKTCHEECQGQKKHKAKEFMLLLHRRKYSG